jgi:hypothetical protein
VVEDCGLHFAVTVIALVSGKCDAGEMNGKANAIWIVV